MQHDQLSNPLSRSSLSQTPSLEAPVDADLDTLATALYAQPTTF